MEDREVSRTESANNNPPGRKQGTSMERHKSQQLSQIYRADDAEFQSASAPPRESAGLGLHARYGMGALMISIEVP